MKPTCYTPEKALRFRVAMALLGINKSDVARMWGVGPEYVAAAITSRKGPAGFWLKIEDFSNEILERFGVEIKNPAGTKTVWGEMRKSPLARVGE